MSDRFRITLAVIAVLLWALYAGVSRAEEVGTLRFYQEEPPEVIEWDFQILYDGWLDLDLSGSIVDQCVGCWELTFTVPDAGWVRARAVGSDGQVSPWSACPVAVPEPGVGLGLMVGVAWLVAIRREASPRRLHQPS